MTTLSEISLISKKIIKASIIFILLFLILKTGYSLGKSVWLYYNPPPEPSPTVAFGVLPQINFPKQEKLTNLKFILETPSGTLPDLPKQAKIFAMSEVKPTFMAAEKAQKEANILGFNTTPQVIKTDVFRWTKDKPTGVYFELNLTSGNFYYTYPWQNFVASLRQKNPPDEETASNEALNFISKIKNIPDDIKNGRIKTRYLKISGNELLPALSLSEANFIKVDFFRQDLEGLPLVTTDISDGIISVLISGDNSYLYRIVEVKYNYFAVDYEKYATYPLKSSSKAWSELEEGKAFFTKINNSQKIVVRRIYLAYFDDFQAQKYLQPVFVFAGDDDFLAYVPAVTQEWSPAIQN